MPNKIQNQRHVFGYDVAIIISYLIFAIFFFYDEYYNIASILEAFLCTILLSLCLKKTVTSNKGYRLKTLLYACNFMIAFPCALKIVELLTNLSLQVDALAIIISGIALQSIYFILISLIKNNN